MDISLRHFSKLYGTGRTVEYAYHIDVKWWVFVVAGIAAVVIALFTVSFQAIKAIANPVTSLRTE